MDVGEALRTRISEELSGHVEKFFNRATDAQVWVARNGVGMEVDCHLSLASGISLQSQGHGPDAHAAFTDALAKLDKRVRRYKRRLRNHHADVKSPLPDEPASAYVLAPLEDEEDAARAETGAAAGPEGGDGPLVIAETTIPVKTMTVSMAVLQLDLAEAPALLFRNAAHGGLNMVYRRGDGNVGWIDPERTR